MIRALPAGRSPAQIALGLLVALFLSVGLAGCPGTIDPSLAAATGGAGSGGGGDCDTTKAMAALAKYNCAQSGCHSGATPISGFDMGTNGWETHLVGGNPTSTSMACAGKGPYLMAGVQPATGLFLDKIKGTQSCGTPMPYPGLTLVAQTDVTCIQSWANTLVAGAGGGNTDAGGGQ